MVRSAAPESRQRAMNGAMGRGSQSWRVAAVKTAQTFEVSETLRQAQGRLSKVLVTGPYNFTHTSRSKPSATMAKVCGYIITR